MSTITRGMTPEEHAQGYFVCECGKFAFVFSTAVLATLPAGYNGEWCAECSMWMCSVEKLQEAGLTMSNRFALLPPANAAHDAHWAASYHCDECLEPDYAHPEIGDGITPFYRDTVTGETICERCKFKRAGVGRQEAKGGGR